MTRQARRVRMPVPGLGDVEVTVPFTRRVLSKSLAEESVAVSVTIDHDDDEGGFYPVAVSVAGIEWVQFTDGSAGEKLRPARLTAAAARRAVTEALSDRALQRAVVAEASTPSSIAATSSDVDAALDGVSGTAQGLGWLLQDAVAKRHVDAGSSLAVAADLHVQPRKGRRLTASDLQEIATAVRDRAVYERPYRAVMALGYSKPHAYALVKRAQAAGYLNEEDVK